MSDPSDPNNPKRSAAMTATPRRADPSRRVESAPAEGANDAGENIAPDPNDPKRKAPMAAPTRDGVQ